MAALREILRVQKLGKNHGGYHGETIDIRVVLRDIKLAAHQHDWSAELFYKTGDLDLFALHRKPVRTSDFPLRTYISTGIHGDEPAGPFAALRLIQENHWPANMEIFLRALPEPGRFCPEHTRERRRALI